MPHIQYRYVTEVEVVVTLDVDAPDVDVFAEDNAAELAYTLASEQVEKIASDDERVRIVGMLDGEAPEETVLP